MSNTSYRRSNTRFATLNLSKYEFLDCEPLYNIKYNILPEIPFLLPSRLNKECQQILDSTLPKQKVSGAFLCVAVIKLLLKLQNQEVDPLLKSLLAQQCIYQGSYGPTNLIVHQKVSCSCTI